MKKKFDIKGFLTINYLLTFAILFIVLLLANLSATFIIQNMLYKNQTFNYSSLNQVYNKDFSKIDIGLIEQFGGWVEILDENKRVIYIKGKKKDNIMEYNERQLFATISSDQGTSANSYCGDLTMVEGKNGEPYILLLKFDKNKFTRKMVYKPDFYEKDDIPFILKTTGIKFGIIAFYLIISIYIYSVISSKFITKPLRTYVDGIKKMSGFDYGTRVHIGVLKELEEVEAEFNKMAKKLQEVEEEKRKIDESKKRLLTDISHDLKTPITSIQGFSKILLEENISTEQREKFLNIIHDKAIYSTVLIEDLFQLSKLDVSEYSISLTESDFNEWLRRLVAEYYEEFKNRGFNLEIVIIERPILFKFDEKLMKRAISNIINNSLKHNNAGTTVRISSSLENNALILKISDSGIGIEEGIKNKIFEPFVKSEEKKSDGSGLGLAITRKIIEKHGGNISLSNSLLDKTLFIICLPL